MGKVEMKKTEYKSKQSFRLVLGFAILMIGSLVFLALNVCIGSVKIPLSDILTYIFHKKQDDTFRVIVTNIRIPRALAAYILGGALALSGYLLQTYFHNPIAGPFVLGISSGAKMVVAIAMVFALNFGVRLHSITMIFAAFVGAMISMGFVLLLAMAVDKMSMLIVAGVMMGYICSAVTEFIVTFADDSNIVNLHNWSLGSFSGTTWDNVATMSVVVVLCLIVVLFMSKPMGAYLLGDAYAKNMGVNVKLFRIMLVLVSSILSATVVAFAGPISFVGVAVPHLVRGLFKTSKPFVLIFACFLGGGIFCSFSDLLARMLFSPTEISVSTITAVLGAPIVIYIMVRRNAEKG